MAGAIAIGLLGLAGSIFALELLREAVRAWRQACRVARYLCGKQWRRKVREPEFRRNFLKQWWHQFGSGEFRINGVVFPSDPARPMRRRWTD